jgi:hypothetical protein
MCSVHAVLLYRDISKLSMSGSACVSADGRWKASWDGCVSLCMCESEASFRYVHFRLVASLHIPVKEDLSSLCDGAMKKKSIKTANPICRLFLKIDQ